MSSKKSLGSSPIGFSGLSRNSYQFIRDLGVSERTNQDPGSDVSTGTGRLISAAGSRRKGSIHLKPKEEHRDEHTEKKIVSYYLEIDLIDRLKALADSRGEYYSSVVNKALESWIKQHDF